MNFFLALLAALLTFVLVLVTTEQVIARYFFDNSSIALQELQWHLFSIIFLLASPYAFEKNRHVRVDIFNTRLSPKWRNRIEIIGLMFFLMPSMMYMTLYGWEFAMASRDFSTSQDFGILNFLLQGEGSSNPGGLPARWLLKLCIPICSTLLMLEAFWQIIEIGFLGRVHDA